MCLAGRASRVLVGLSLLLLVAACRSTPPPREYDLVGQVTAVDRSTGYVTVRHQDIKGFMPGMTMPFAVKEKALVDAVAPGDLIEATLMVQGAEAWIGRLRKTGHAALPEAPSPVATGLAPGDRVSDQRFVNEDDKPLAMSWLDGHVSVLTFVYTRCPLPDFCPAIDRRFAEVQQAIVRDGASGALSGVRLLSISIDPAYDQPPVLKAHAQKLGATPGIWHFVATSPEEIGAFGRQFGLDLHRSGSGPADLEHNLRTVVLDRDRRVVQTLTGTGWSAAELIARLRAAAGA